MKRNEGKAVLEELLAERQELIRDYQMRAQAVEEPAVHRMLKHLAEADAKLASDMKEQLHTMG